MIMAAARARAKAKVVERYVDLVVCVCILRVCCGIISYLLYFFIFHRATTPRIPRVPRVPRKTRAPRARVAAARAREVERSAPRARVVAARARADEEVDTEGILKLITGQRLTTFQKKRPN